jgi:hypothetical protein
MSLVQAALSVQLFLMARLEQNRKKGVILALNFMNCPNDLILTFIDELFEQKSLRTPLP